MTGGLVDRAQRRGLVARTVSPTDRRSFQVSLMKDGRALAGRVGAQFTARILEIVADLPAADRKALSRLASQVVRTAGPELSRRD